MIILHRSPFSRNATDYHNHTGRLIDWLTDNYPHGFGTGITATLNGEPLPLDDLDCYLLEADVVEITVTPAGPEIGAYILNAVIALAVSYVVQRVFGPKPPRAPGFAEAAQPSPIYSVAVAQNATRIGEAIPVIYGNVVTTPDYAAQPYLAYTEVALKDNTGPAGYDIEFLDNIGGLLGTTATTWPQAYLFWYHVGPPGVTGWNAVDTGSASSGLVEGTFTLIGNFYPSGMFALSPNTNATDPAALRLDLIDPAGTYNYRITNKRASGGILIERQRGNNGDQYLCALMCIGCGEFDAVAASDVRIGDTYLNTMDPATYTFGAIGPATHSEEIGPISFLMAIAGAPAGTPTFWENVVTALEVGDQELIAANDQTLFFPVGNADVSTLFVDIAFPRGLYRINTSGAFVSYTVRFQILVQLFVNGAWQDNFSRTVDIRNNAVADVSPWRRSLAIQVGPGRYRVALKRITAAAPTDGTTSDALQWVGLRGFISPNPSSGQYAYGDTTIFALRLRANNLLSENATSRIQVAVKRNVPSFGVDRNPAVAMFDIFTNTDYGGRRGLNEIDGDMFNALYARWSTGSLGFNAAFTEQVTMFEALQSALIPGVAEPILVNGLLSARYEGVRNSRTQLFTDANIIQDSLSISYSYNKVGEPDGVQVQYRNPSTWKPEYYTYPENALNPDKVNLFGVADGFSAVFYARFLWQRRFWTRKRISFDVESEGNLPLPGDLIGVQQPVVYISAGGNVVAFDSGTRLMQLEIPFTFIGGTTYAIVLRDQYGVPLAPITITPVDSTHVTLATVPGIPINDIYGNQPTVYAIGKSDIVVSDWLVDSVVPNGDKVFTIDGSNYNAAIYDNSFSFLKTVM